jgi:hypothetical protein
MVVGVVGGADATLPTPTHAPTASLSPFPPFYPFTAHTHPQVHDWQALKGKNVAVVGAGASALDMAINALKANEGQPASVKLHWLLRHPKHFGGFDYADLFLLTIFQVRGRLCTLFCGV